VTANAVHVEEFKKELTREVLISTQEVGRLQRERQLLEQQIADLFAFYSKQKQTVLVSEHINRPDERNEYSAIFKGKYQNSAANPTAETT
jgi:hypothetical protein